jgi:hypothetical protein
MVNSSRTLPLYAVLWSLDSSTLRTTGPNSSDSLAFYRLMLVVSP